MAWAWYGVKTLYRWAATGRPDMIDEDYDADATLIEERVVLVKARNFDEAIQKAEKEACNYAKQPVYTNVYGQKVRMKYLKRCDAFQMYDPPAADVEVYSATEIVSLKVKDSEVANKRLGKEEKTKTQRKRKKFSNRELAVKYVKEMSESGEM